MPPAILPAFDVEAVIDEFPILQRETSRGERLVFLDTAASAQKPQCVIDAISDCYATSYANVHRGIYELADRATTLVEDARQKVRQLLNAKHPEEIIFTSGTTMSINVVAGGWGRKFLNAGDEIVLTEFEHHANLVPWQQVAKERGAVLRFLPLTTDGRIDLEQAASTFSDRTKLLAVSGMSNVLGTIPPLEALIPLARERGALVLVDGAQSVPHLPVDVQAADVDFLVFSGHKLYGPSGVGVLYGKQALLESMDPFLFGGNMIREVQRESSTWGDLPSKFEAGTVPIAPIAGLGAAVDFITRLGLPAVHAHEQALLEYAHELLAPIPGMTIYGPAPAHKGAILSFTVEGLHAHDMAALLDRHGVAVRAGHHCTMPLHDLLQVPATTRASFAAYNKKADVEALAEAIGEARKVFRLG